jgi:exonuclease I
MAHTFFWHDYETFGAQPRYDRPAQFAGIRTDAELNEIGEPVMWYCQPAGDYLPDPQSCLITGITPQQCLEQGMPEAQFAARIEAELAQAGTVGVGYNTIRFDDEITRFMFWRSLIDPYAREWQNGCGRWDLLDVVRMVYALRPEGIVWPKKEDGSPSFKLEDLARANGLLHEKAHDALSDVRATIGLARLIRKVQPRLFDFAFALHKKDRVLQEMGLPADAAHARPFLHVSGMIRPERGCITVMWPLATHPTNKNEIICWDLTQDPSAPAPFLARGGPARGRAAPAHQEHPRQQVAHGGRQPQDPEPGHGRAMGRGHGAMHAARSHRARPARHECAVARRPPAPGAGRAGRRPGPVRRLRGQRGPAPAQPPAQPVAPGIGAGPHGLR